jgi:GTP-binding protein
MDMRHPLKPLDWQLLDYCHARHLPVHILLNKADKLSKGAVAKTLKEVKTALAASHQAVTCQSFSAATGAGLKELYGVLNEWYAY